MNKYTGDKGALHDFCAENDLVDTVALINPDIKNYPTYIHRQKRSHYIFTSSVLTEVAIKRGRHQFHQLMISNHKGVYFHFNGRNLFDSSTFEKSHASYRKLRMRRRGIVKCITRLENLYKIIGY